MEQKKEAKLLKREGNEKPGEGSGEDDQDSSEENGSNSQIREGIEQVDSSLESDTDNEGDLSGCEDGQVN